MRDRLSLDIDIALLVMGGRQGRVGVPQCRGVGQARVVDDGGPGVFRIGGPDTMQILMSD